MKRNRLGIALALVVLATAAHPGATRAEEPGGGEAAAPKADDAKVERGRYLVVFGGCNDCHTPLMMGENGPEPDMSRMLSGHPEKLSMPPVPPLPEGPWGVVAAATITAWAGPFGVSFTRNLTPDPETGLGNWTEREFIDTLRNGRERGIGREMLPPMPWQGIGQATDEDLSAIWAYLRSIPPISNRVPDPLPPPPPPAKE